MSPPKHGLPDWGVTAGAAAVYQMTDLGEAVARLGSPVSFDRRGDVIFIDSFEAGINRWVPYQPDATAKVCASRATARTGVYSARLFSGYYSPLRAAIYSWLALPILSNCGLEASYAADCLSGIMTWCFEFYTGTQYARFHIRYRPVEDDMQLLYGQDKWQTVLSDLRFFVSIHAFNTIKLVIDPLNLTYLRLLANNYSADLTAYSPYTTTLKANPRLMIEFAVEGDSLFPSDIHIDDVIITQNEPDQP